MSVIKRYTLPSGQLINLDEEHALAMGLDPADGVARRSEFSTPSSQIVAGKVPPRTTIMSATGMPLASAIPVEEVPVNEPVVVAAAEEPEAIKTEAVKEPVVDETEPVNAAKTEAASAPETKAQTTTSTEEETAAKNKARTSTNKAKG